MTPPLRQMEPRNGSAVSVRFTALMRGHVAFGEQDYLEGARTGQERGTDLMLRLTIVVDPVDGFIQDPRHHAIIRGHVRCDALGGKLPIEDGFCNLFAEEDDPRLRRVLFRVHFRDVVGHPLTLSGFQTIGRNRSLPVDVGPDSTTLFTRIIRGHVPEPDDPSVEIAASGVVRLRPIDVARQLASFRTQGPTRRQRYRSLSALVEFLTRELWVVYARRGLRSAARP